jgi:hypothetical protein
LGIFNPLLFKNWITELLIAVTVDSYFETLLKKNENVPPIRDVNPKKNKINPNITIRIASHLGTLFFSSQEMGCIQMMLIKSASSIGAMIDFAKINPAKITTNDASFNKGESSVDPMRLMSISELFYEV